MSRPYLLLLQNSHEVVLEFNQGSHEQVSQEFYPDNRYFVKRKKELKCKCNHVTTERFAAMLSGATWLFKCTLHVVYFSRWGTHYSISPW